MHNNNKKQHAHARGLLERTRRECIDLYIHLCVRWSTKGLHIPNWTIHGVATVSWSELKNTLALLVCICSFHKVTQRQPHQRSTRARACLSVYAFGTFVTAAAVMLLVVSCAPNHKCARFLLLRTIHMACAWTSPGMDLIARTRWAAEYGFRWVLRITHKWKHSRT